jgi:hypothetical protein
VPVPARSAHGGPQLPLGGHSHPTRTDSSGPDVLDLRAGLASGRSRCREGLEALAHSQRTAAGDGSGASGMGTRFVSSSKSRRKLTCTQASCQDILDKMPASEEGDRRSMSSKASTVWEGSSI